MDDDAVAAYEEAGEILRTALEIGKNAINEGVPHHDVATQIEAYIRDQGAAPAFPVNISINNEAAHRTPHAEEDTTFSADDVVCLDVGVHVDGYPVDAATTVDLGERATTEKGAAEAALNEAITHVEAGVHPQALGERIHDVLDDYGVQPVQNLMGHGLSRWEAHESPTIPNTRASPEGGRPLQSGDVIAVEPFVTTGRGTVTATDNVGIFEKTGDAPVRNRTARAVIQELENQGYDQFPFTDRWLTSDNARRGVRRLVQRNVLTAYPVLADVDDSLVAQAEHTLLVESDGCRVLTR